MSKYLVVYSIGPVQSFIATSRKTEDLWSGSYLLSELVTYAMTYTEEIIGINNIQWIQPNHDKDIESNSMAANPNRFLFFADVESKEKIKTYLGQITDKLNNYLTQLTQDSVKMMFNFKELPEDIETQIKNQTENFLELFWAFQPYDEEEDEFHIVRARNEQNLASVKNNRLSNIRVREGLACSLCRNEDMLATRIPTKKQSFSELKKNSRQLWKGQEPRKAQESNGKIKKGEYLCSVCTLKRMLRKMPNYKKFGTFPSVQVFST